MRDDIRTMWDDQDEWPDLKNALIAHVTRLAITIALCLLTDWILSSCKQVEYIPVVSTEHDSIYISKVQRDSIWVHDSISLEAPTSEAPATVVKWHTEYRYKIVTDTVRVIETDTIIRYESKASNEQPASINWWKAFAWIFTIIIIGYMIAWIAKRLRLQ